MNILFILDNYWPFKGGAETLFKNLAEGLAKEGNSVTVLTRKLKGTKKNEQLNGVKIHRISTINRYLFTFLAIPKAISLARKADIIHTTTFNSALPAWKASKLTRKPCVMTVHEVWLGKWGKYTSMDKYASLMHELLERPIYMLGFDRFVCVSNSTKKQLTTSCRINEKKVSVIYNGVDYSHFDPKKHSGKGIRKKLGLEKSFACLVYGRAAPSKGMEYAAKAVSMSRANAKFLFIVAKDYSESYSKFIEILKKADKSKFLLLDPVSYNELPEYIAASDCVIVPSLSEGFGYAAAESCAMGKPVIASNATSLPEVVSGKFLLVEPRNPKAIAEAIEKASKGKYHKSKLRKFTIEENVKRHMELYRKLLGKA